MESGELGKVLLMHGQYLQDWLLNETDWNWRLEPGLGGDMRVVADIGSHWLDLMTFIGGKRLKEVCADFATLMETRKKPTKPVETFAGKTLDPADYEEIPITTEDYAAILLRYEDGVHGVCTVSQMSAGRKNHLAFEVDCAKASLAFNSENPEQLWIGRRDRPSESLLRDPALLSPSARSTTDYPGGHAEGFPDTFKQLYKKVYAAIDAGAPPEKPDYPTFADGVYSLQVGEALLQSARENRWVTIRAGSKLGKLRERTRNETRNHDRCAAEHAAARVGKLGGRKRVRHAGGRLLACWQGRAALWRRDAYRRRRAGQGGRRRYEKDYRRTPAWRSLRWPITRTSSAPRVRAARF